MPRKFDFISPGIEITEVDQSILPAETDAEGPIIIGRTSKGPALKPIKIRSLEDYVTIFGNPNPGGDAPSGDLWRDGAGAAAPEYASFAAQSWLAGGTSPVTMVRLLGKQHENVTTGLAGWQLSGSIPDNSATSNSTAYGLFVVDKTAAGDTTNGTVTFATQHVHNVKLTIAGHVFHFEDAASGTITLSAGDTKVSVDTASDVTNDVAAKAATTIQTKLADGTINNVAIDVDAAIITVYNKSTSDTVALATDDAAKIAVSTATIAVAGTATGTGCLAAVFYCNTGQLALSGKIAGGSDTKINESVLVESTGDNVGFTLKVKNTSGTVVDTINFNFARTSGNYIRKKFSTNPTLINDNITQTSSQKTYWLGESFERFVNDTITTKTASQVYGVLLPLHKNDEATKKGNWGYRRQSYEEGQSGWVFSQDFSDENSAYSESSQPKMFRFALLHDGESAQKSFMISFESLTLPPNPEVYAYSSFDVVIKDVANGSTVERFSGCNMDPNSQNFVARRIGDMFHEWDYTEKRWKSYGDYLNVSSYVRIIMVDSLPDQKSALPFGFLGPARPKSFSIMGSEESVKSLDGSDFAGAFVKKSRSDISGEFIEHSLTDLSLEFQFPKLSLRNSGTDGFAANPYKAMYGIRPKVDSKSNLYDNDYCDYIRSLPSEYKSNNYAPSGDFEHSFVFSLDNLVIDEDKNIVTYTDSSRKGGTSYTATAGKDVESLLSLGVGQWAMPLFGGFDGLDITELEPYRRGLTNDSDTDVSNYLQNSLSIAIESVSDEEQVPANLLLSPGFTDSHITQRLVSVADSRKDCLAIIDLSTGDYLPKAERITTDSENSDAVRGKVSTAVTGLKTRQLNSSYAAAFYPWIQIKNTLGNDELVWVPPSIAALGAMAKTDSTSELWFAPAGFNRGGLDSLGGRSGPVVVQARQKLDSRDRDDLYKVNINPIASFPNEGLVIFGQKTLQQANSALDRINVRRLMIFLKKEISEVAKNTLFQNNVPATWDDFKGRAEPILSSVKNRFGLTDYRLVLDETTTTPDLIDRNILYAKVFLKPARAIEYIAIDFVITKTGADFV